MSAFLKSILSKLRSTSLNKNNNNNLPKSQILIEESKEISNKDNNQPAKVLQVFELTENFQCRICQDTGDPNQEVCIPCECAGSMKYVHENCLKEWLKMKKSLECEICNRPYNNKWKIWAYENNIIKVKEDDKESKNIIANILLKIIPLLSLVFFLYSIIAFTLTSKSLRNDQKYYCLVNYFRWIFYCIVYILLFFTCYYFNTYCTFEKEEKELIQDLKNRIARFVREQL